MSRWTSANVVVLLLCSVIASAQEPQEPIDDRGVGTADHNFFAVNHSPELKQLLENVEGAHLGAAGDQMREGRFHYAIAELGYILDRFVNHPTALQMMATVAKLTKNRSLPIRYFERAISLYPRYALTHAQYGSYLVDIGQMEAGIARLEHAIRMDSKLVAAHVWIAKAYQQVGQLARAEEASRTARELGYKGRIW
jgi:Tfp pilus assembly protein PilF